MAEVTDCDLFYCRNVICLLELQCDDDFVDTNEANPHIALDHLRMTWATMQIGQKNLLDRMPLTDIEVQSMLSLMTFINRDQFVNELPNFTFTK